MRKARVVGGLAVGTVVLAGIGVAGWWASQPPAADSAAEDASVATERVEAAVPDSSCDLEALAPTDDADSPQTKENKLTNPASIALPKGTEPISRTAAATVAAENPGSKATLSSVDHAVPVAVARMSYKKATIAMGSHTPGDTEIVAGDRCVWIATVERPLTVTGPAQSERTFTYPKYTVILDGATGQFLELQAGGDDLVDVITGQNFDQKARSEAQS